MEDMNIQLNVQDVERKISAACERSGRKREDVLLLAVSKTMGVDTIKQAIAAGCTSLGENKVQEIMDKYEPIGEGVDWHLIGHLQTNKVKYIIDKVKMIHSVESVKLAEEINKRAGKIDRVMDVLVEINIGEEDSKFGIQAEDAEGFIREIAKMEHICVKGLMTVAPFVEDPEQNRRYFKKMKQLLVDINQKKIDNVYMDVLSMGMTGDYEVAIEEGATVVRVGTGIFGKRVYL